MRKVVDPFSQLDLYLSRCLCAWQAGGHSEASGASQRIWLNLQDLTIVALQRTADRRGG